MIKKYLSRLSMALVMLTGLLLTQSMIPSRVMAADCSKSFIGLPTWYAYLDVQSPDCVPLGSNGNPIEGIDDLTGVIPNVVVAIVDLLLRVSGMVAFIYIIVSGFRFVLSQGNPEKEKQARSAIINAIIGMLVAIFAAFVVQFIGNRLS